MSSVCISKCVDDARVPIRATYVNLYKWPESDAEFVKTAAAGGGGGGRPRQHPRVVDSISCRQMYLRSYTFSRKETVPERTRKCFVRVRERVAGGGGGEEGGGRRRRKREEVRDRAKKACAAAARRAKELSCAVYRSLLSCAASVDVADYRDR